MKEQSHKDEMSKALRGDFERLRDRGVATTLAPRDDSQHPQPTPDEPDSVDEREPAPELTGPEAEPELTERKPEPEPVTQPSMDTPVAEADGPRSGWLDRLLGR